MESEGAKLSAAALDSLTRNDTALWNGSVVNITKAFLKNYPHKIRQLLDKKNAPLNSFEIAQALKIKPGTGQYQVMNSALTVLRLTKHAEMIPYELKGGASAARWQSSKAPIVSPQHLEANPPAFILQKLFANRFGANLQAIVATKPGRMGVRPAPRFAESTIHRAAEKLAKAGLLTVERVRVNAAKRTAAGKNRQFRANNIYKITGKGSDVVKQLKQGKIPLEHHSIFVFGKNI